MKTTLKIQNIENILSEAKKTSPELENLFVQKGDSRIGNKYALINKDTLEQKTDYMLINELNQFIRGYIFKSEKRIK